MPNIDETQAHHPMLICTGSPSFPHVALLSARGHTFRPPVPNAHPPPPVR